MTTITVEIDKEKDLSALTKLIGQLGLNYQINVNDGLLYSNDVKTELDKRYAEFLNGKEMISSDESTRRVQSLLNAKGN